MNRQTKADTDLRVQINKIIKLINQHNPDNDFKITQLLIETWDQYFSDNRVYQHDQDFLEVINTLTIEYCSDELKHAYQSALTAISKAPILYKVENKLLNNDNRYLLKFRKNITSQDGEDGIIEKIFDTIGTQNKWCVEFGAYDGLTNCNTHTLVTSKNWNAIFIEGDSDLYGLLVKTYDGCATAHLFNKLIGNNPGLTPLDSILSDLDVPHDFDLISIDIDGNDWQVWKNLNQYQPRVVIIEFNPTIANDIVFIQKDDQNTRQGNSLLSLILLGREKGYELICVTMYNAFFVIKEEFEKFNISDNSIDAMYEPMMDGRIFQCYDGSINNVGMPRLIWGLGDSKPDIAKIGINDIKLVR